MFPSLRPSSPRFTGRRRPPRRALRPRLDPLEGRALLSTFTVTNTDGSGPGSLAAAVQAADAGGEAATIDFAPGVIGTIELGGAPLVLAVPVTIDGPGASALTVSGSGAGRAMTVDAGVSATVVGLTIADGVAERGAGIDNFGSLDLAGCVVKDNQAVSTDAFGADGGGVCNEAGATLYASNTTFDDNQGVVGGAEGGLGGAIVDFGDATIEGCRFTSNQVFGAETFNSLGGAIAMRGGSLDVVDSSFVGNQAINNQENGPGTFGGAIFSLNGTTTLTGCVFSDNQAQALPSFAAGGAIEAEGTGSMMISGCVFSGNQALSSTFGAVGGAVDSFGPALSIAQSRFSGNIVDGGTSALGQGGALNDTASPLTASDDVFDHNQALGGEGISGGVEVDNTVATFTSAVFLDNSAIGIGAGGSAFAGAFGMDAYNGQPDAVTITGATTFDGNQAIGADGATGVTTFGGGIGGAIQTQGATSLEINGATFTDNLARAGDVAPGATPVPNVAQLGLAAGGAIEMDSGGSLTLDGGRIADNQAIGGAGGGGVGGDGDGTGGAIALLSGSSAVLDGTAIEGNRAIGGAGGGYGAGGGISLDFGSSCTVQAGSLIAGNTAAGASAGTASAGGLGLGGGISVGIIGSTYSADGSTQVPDNSTLIVDGGALQDNQAVGGDGPVGGVGAGGGIESYTTGTVQIEASLLLANSARGGDDGGDGLGGALNIDAGIVTVTDDSLRRNQAVGGDGGDGLGGGIAVDAPAALGSLTILGSTVMHNTASGGSGGVGEGGGVYIVTGADVSIDPSSTITHNHAQIGPDIYGTFSVS